MGLKYLDYFNAETSEGKFLDYIGQDVNATAFGFANGCQWMPMLRVSWCDVDESR